MVDARRNPEPEIASMRERISIRQDKRERLYAERWSMSAMRWIRMPLADARRHISQGATLVNETEARKLLATDPT